jgi:tetratricopeptide (TPR) repeat protein
LLEDMHFADEASVAFVDAALRRTRTAALFTLATARPDGRARPPSVYDTRAMAAWPMEALPAEAAVQLTTSVLGAVPPGELDAIVERAGGNALYLEELLRAHRAGYDAESLMGLLTARILTFPTEARRVLQAASVFGERFTTREVSALLGDRADDAPAWLRDLEQREALRPLGEGRYGFRHGLVRDAAYAMLTEEERRLDHRLAGQLLEPRGDPSLVAEHFEHAGDRAESIAKHDQAATVALARSDCAGALRHVRRAIECGAHGAELSHLQGVAAEAHNRRGAHTEAALASLAAMAGLAEGSAEFHHALTEHIVASARTGNVDRVLEMARRVLGLPSLAETAGLRAIALARAASSLLFSKHRAEGLRIVTEVEALLAAHPQDDLLVVALARELRGHRARALGDLASPRALFEGAADAHELLGSERNAASCRVAAASSACKVGQWERAESLLRSALLTAERLGIDALATAAHSNLGLALLGQARVDEAIVFERRAIDACVLAADARLEGGSRVVLARLLLGAGQPQAAAEEAMRAVDALSVDPLAQAVARAVLARTKVALGDADGALDTARKAMEAVRVDGMLADGEVLIRLAHADALAAKGDTMGAREAVTAASAKLLERAAHIDDEELRKTFLERVPEHTEVLARVRATTAS